MKVMLGTHCEFCVKMLVKGLIVAIFTSSCIFSAHELVLHFRFHSSITTVVILVMRYILVSPSFFTRRK